MDQKNMAVFSNFLGSGPSKLTFRVEHVDVAVVNALRRTIMADVPTPGVAFDPHDPSASDIVVHANNTALHNEFLAHRVSLLPIRLPVVGGSSSAPDVPDVSQYRFQLKANSGADANVTTRHITIFLAGSELGPEFHRRVFPPYVAPDGSSYDALIAKLPPDGGSGSSSGSGSGELHIEFSARLGTGRQHARWCPVSLCTYECDEDAAAAERELEARLRDGRLSEGPGQPDPRARFNSMDRQRFFVKDAFGTPCSFTFKLESESSYTPGQAFDLGLGVLIQRVQGCLAAVRCCRDPAVLFDEDSGVATVTFAGEGHTLGNLLQALIYNMHSATRGDGKLDYIGYAVPHPLKEEMVLKLKLREPQAGVSGVRSLLCSAVSDIANGLRELQQAFQEAAAASNVPAARLQPAMDGIPSVVREAPAPAPAPEYDSLESGDEFDGLPRIPVISTRPQQHIGPPSSPPPPVARRPVEAEAKIDGSSAVTNAVVTKARAPKKAAAADAEEGRSGQPKPSARARAKKVAT